MFQPTLLHQTTWQNRYIKAATKTPLIALFDPTPHRTGLTQTLEAQGFQVLSINSRRANCFDEITNLFNAEKNHFNCTLVAVVVEAYHLDTLKRPFSAPNLINLLNCLGFTNKNIPNILYTKQANAQLNFWNNLDLSPVTSFTAVIERGLEDEKLLTVLNGLKQHQNYHSENLVYSAIA